MYSFYGLRLNVNIINGIIDIILNIYFRFFLSSTLGVIVSFSHSFETRPGPASRPGTRACGWVGSK